MNKKNKIEYDVVGLRILGVEKRKDIVDLINKGKAHFSESGLDELLISSVKEGHLIADLTIPSNAVCNTYIITVGTPLDDYGDVRLDMIKNATEQVASHMSDDSTVILRSTVKVGVTRNVVKPILAKTRNSFSIAMCPERTLEGSAIKELRRIPQIIGADDIKSSKRCVDLFSKLTKTVIQVGSLETAEIVKLVDNTYRDVNFAFANEVARACEIFGVNASEVINAGKLGYERTNVAIPGLVGGPCLEKDPHIFNQSVLEHGISLDITTAARKVNERQPKETVDTIFKKIESCDFNEEIIISILGIAFKGYPETDDLRGAMSLKIIDNILNRCNQNCKLRIYDPVIESQTLRGQFPNATVFDSLKQVISGAHVVIITNNHKIFGSLYPKTMINLMEKDGFVYDYWNHFSNINDDRGSDSYYALGNIKDLRK